MLVAVDFGAIGITFFLAVIVILLVFLFRGYLQSRDEAGSEIALAANRKEYLSDEELEGPKLDRALTFALIFLLILSTAFTMYMVAEPGRAENAQEGRQAGFARAGETLYNENCAACHSAGGTGGSAPYVLQDADGQFIRQTSWKAPAINNVMNRFSEEEVRHVLNYGRPGSPMAAWGTPGGGPMTVQDITKLIAYLDSINVQSLDNADIMLAGTEDPNDAETAEAQALADEAEKAIRAEVERSLESGEFETLGEAVFNLGLYSEYEGGALSCARCHTGGWSIAQSVEAKTKVLQDGIAACGGAVSGIGYNLCGDSLKERFADDSWKTSEGTWMPVGGLTDEQGKYIESLEGARIALDDKGVPVTSTGQPYLILGQDLDVISTTVTDEQVVEENDEDDAEEDDTAPEEQSSTSGATDAAPIGEAGDLAQCNFVSKLYTTADGTTYPIAPDAVAQEENGALVEPEELLVEDMTGAVYELENGKLAQDCTIVKMPERTSQAQYDFVYEGAEAAQGYGNGGQSGSGMMPGFGKLLPEDYIQAAVDYERSLQ